MRVFWQGGRRKRILTGTGRYCGTHNCDRQDKSQRDSREAHLFPFQKDLLGNFGEENSPTGKATYKYTTVESVQEDGDNESSLYLERKAL